MCVIVLIFEREKQTEKWSAVFGVYRNCKFFAGIIPIAIWWNSKKIFARSVKICSSLQFLQSAGETKREHCSRVLFLGIKMTSCRFADWSAIEDEADILLWVNRFFAGNTRELHSSPRNSDIDLPEQSKSLFQISRHEIAASCQWKPLFLNTLALERCIWRRPISPVAAGGS